LIACQSNDDHFVIFRIVCSYYCSSMISLLMIWKAGPNQLMDQFLFNHFFSYVCSILRKK